MAYQRRTVMDHLLHPSNAGNLPSADGVGKSTLNGNAPYVTFFLKVSQSIVTDARFLAFGCGYTIAMCSALTETVIGCPLAECRTVDESNIMDSVINFPEDRRYCATLAINALRDALKGLEPHNVNTQRP